MPMVTIFQPTPGDCVLFNEYIGVLIYQPSIFVNHLGLIAVDSQGNCTKVDDYQFRRPITFENATPVNITKLPELQRVAIQAIKATQI